MCTSSCWCRRRSLHRDLSVRLVTDAATDSATVGLARSCPLLDLLTRKTVMPGVSGPSSFSFPFFIGQVSGKQLTFAILYSWRNFAQVSISSVSFLSGWLLQMRMEGHGSLQLRRWILFIIPPLRPHIRDVRLLNASVVENLKSSWHARIFRHTSRKLWL